MYLTGVIVAFFVSFLVLMYQSTIRIRNGEETLVYGLIVSVVTSFIFSLFSWITVFIFPYIYLKKRKRNQASKLFSSHEKSLLFKSQEVIRMNSNGLIKPNINILTVAQLIEDSRVEYQIMNESHRLEITFMELLLPRLELLKLEITDWGNVNSYFEIE